jgi:CTP:molybdopterin cytidylyltransferase MocA
MLHRIPFGAVLLAAGLSGRMGMPKPFLRFRREGVSFLEQGLRLLFSAGCGEAAVVLNERDHGLLDRRHWDLLYGERFPGKVMTVINPFPHFGRLLSVQLGLSVLQAGPPALLHNIDHPLVRGETLHSMLEAFREASSGTREGDSPDSREYSIHPLCRGRGGHPVLVSPALACRLTETGSRSSTLREVLGAFPRLGVQTEDSGVMANINTPNDYLSHGLPL